MRVKNDLPLTDEQKLSIRKMRAVGKTMAQIAIKISCSVGQVIGYCTYYRVPDQHEIKVMELEKRMQKEMPERWYSVCKTVAFDKELAEKELLKHGEKIQPINRPLSERPRIFSLGGAVLGNPNVRVRDVNWA